MDAARDLLIELRTLAEQLVKEPFCRQYGLADQALGKVALFIEQRDANPDRAAPEAESLKQSFRNFKAIWVLFLMQLEQVSPITADQMNQVTLNTWLNGDSASEPAEEVTMAGAHLVLTPKPPPPTAEELGVSAAVEELLQPSITMVGEPEDEKEASDKTVMGNIVNYVTEPEEKPAPADRPLSENVEEIEILLPVIPVGEPASATSTMPVPPVPVLPKELKAIPIPLMPADEGDLTPMKPTRPEPVRRPEPTPAAAPPEVANEMTPLNELTSEISDWSLPEDEENQLPSEVTAAGPMQPTIPAAQEYHALALYFRDQRIRGESGIVESHLTRLETQQLIFSIELEFQECLAQVVPRFWPKRKASLVPLWDPSSAKGDFHGALLKCWDEMTKDSPVWPKDEKLPATTFKNSLRFVALAPETAVVRLSPLEAGLWIFLFGQDRDLGGLKLRNLLGMPTVDTSKVQEVFLRLCRVHRMKSLLSKPSSRISESDRQEMEDHAEALFVFTNEWLHGNNG